MSDASTRVRWIVWRFSCPTCRSTLDEITRWCHKDVHLRRLWLVDVHSWYAVSTCRCMIIWALILCAYTSPLSPASISILAEMVMIPFSPGMNRVIGMIVYCCLDVDIHTFIILSHYHLSRSYSVTVMHAGCIHSSGCGAEWVSCRCTSWSSYITLSSLSGWDRT